MTTTDFVLKAILIIVLGFLFSAFVASIRAAITDKSEFIRMLAGFCAGMLLLGIVYYTQTLVTIGFLT